MAHDFVLCLVMQGREADKRKLRKVCRPILEYRVLADVLILGICSTK